jgi:hypothetical protein
MKFSKNNLFSVFQINIGTDFFSPGSGSTLGIRILVLEKIERRYLYLSFRIMVKLGYGRELNTVLDRSAAWIPMRIRKSLFSSVVDPDPDPDQGGQK